MFLIQNSSYKQAWKEGNMTLAEYMAQKITGMQALLFKLSFACRFDLS